MTACYLTIILALTARRARVAPATLAIGGAAGLLLGLVMYAITPLGLNVKYPYRPWLSGAMAETVGTAAWILLFGAPLIAGAIGAWRCHLPDDPREASVAYAWQGFAAGLVSGGIGAVFVTVFGSGSVALLVRSARVREWLYHGQHLTASAVYGRELFATQDAGFYLFLLVPFPIIGVIMGLIGAAIAGSVRRLPDGSAPQASSVPSS